MSKTGFREILCVFLLFVLLAFAGIAESFNAQIVLRDAEGNEYGTIDLIPVTTSGGETGYWFNLFGMDEQKVQALQSGNSVIRAYRPDTGEQLPDVPIAADAGIATLFEGETVHRSDVADPTNEALRFPILSSYQDAPADQTALDGVMQQLGFTVQEYTEPVNPPQEPEEVPPEITVPQFMAPGYDGVEIRQSPNGEVAGTVNASDVLTGYDYELDAQGGVWFNVQSYATDVQGYVNSEAVSPLDEAGATGRMRAIQDALAETSQPPEQNDEQPPEQTNTQPQTITVPQFMAPGYDGVELRQSPNGEAAGTVNASDVLTGYDYELDAQGGVWFNVQSYATGAAGYVNSEAVSPLESAAGTDQCTAADHYGARIYGTRLGWC